MLAGGPHTQELKGEAEAAKMAMSEPYACTVLAHSTPHLPHSDRKFFEALASSLLGVLMRVGGARSTCVLGLGRAWRQRKLNLVWGTHGRGNGRCRRQHEAPAMCMHAFQQGVCVSTGAKVGKLYIWAA